MSPQNKALVLLVHGSRDPAWMRPFLELAEDVENGSGTRVAIACLQFCQPDLTSAVEELADEGYRNIIVVPLFISALGHVLKDVPGELAAAKESFPGLNVKLWDALGELPEVRQVFLDALVRIASPE